jgi:tRNA A58 N-methylase Trm61
VSCAPYVATSPEVVHRMLKLAEIIPNDLVFDLGSGDGRILITAIKDYNAKGGIGYEINSNLFKVAIENIRKVNLHNRIALFNEDLFKADLSKATVITLYLTSWANEKLRPKFENEIVTGTRIVSHDFSIHGWRPKIEDKFHGHTIYVYDWPQ